MSEKKNEPITYQGLTERLRDILSSGEKIRVEEVLKRMGMKDFERRELRQLCENAITHYGIPIGASTKGLFLVTNQQSFDEAHSFLFKQMIAYGRRIEALEQAYGINVSVDLEEDGELF